MSLDNNYELDREAEKQRALGKAKTSVKALKVEYQKAEAAAVVMDLLRQLDDWHASASAAGAAAVDNSTTQSSYLQRSYAYETVRSYIRDKLL